MIDPPLRLIAAAILTALILAPAACLCRVRNALALLGRELTSSIVALMLATVIVGLWCRIYLDGCRLGWWAALAAALAGWWDV